MSKNNIFDYYQYHNFILKQITYNPRQGITNDKDSDFTPAEEKTIIKTCIRNCYATTTKKPVSLKKKLKKLSFEAHWDDYR